MLEMLKNCCASLLKATSILLKGTSFLKNTENIKLRFLIEIVERGLDGCYWIGFKDLL